MADTDKPQEKIYSESDLLTLAADRAARETAELSAKVAELTTAKDEVANKLDVEIAAREAAEKRAEEAESKHDEFVKAQEAEKAAAARKDERLAKVREAASHLPDSFYEDEGRVARIVSMEDEAFEGYLADMRETASGVPAGTSGAPRETAMSGDPVTGDAKPGTAASNFLMRPYVVPTEKGA